MDLKKVILSREKRNISILKLFSKQPKSNPWLVSAHVKIAEVYLRFYKSKSQMKNGVKNA